MALKDTDDGKPEAEEADVSLDMSQAAVKKMIADAKERGYITYDQLNQHMPPEHVSSEQIEDVMSMLSEMGINVIEDEEVEEGEAPVAGELVETSTSREVAIAGTATETLDRTDDPVRMYLREMGSVELLSREGEIAIAKRIEAGRNTMIAGLCESPLTSRPSPSGATNFCPKTSSCAMSSTLRPPSAAAWMATRTWKARRWTKWPWAARPRALRAGMSRNWTPTATPCRVKTAMTRMTKPRTCRWPRWKPR